MLRFIAFTCILLMTTACGRQQAKELLAQIEGDDYRNTYERAPEWPDPLMPSAGGPHGDWVDIYVNDVITEAIASGESLSEWPEGSLIVKDGWNDEEGTDLKYIALMEKRDGGEWFWAEYHPDGRVFVSGLDRKACSDCHSSGEDQVLAFGLPSGAGE